MDTDPAAGICVGIADISFVGIGVRIFVGEFWSGLESGLELVDSFVAAGIAIGFGEGSGVGVSTCIGEDVEVGCGVGVG